MKNKMNTIINNGDTCIVEYKSNSFNSLITQNNMIGFRVPNYPFLITLLSEYNKPITTTSINTTGQKPINDPDEIEKIFGTNIDLIVDGGIIENKPASKIYIFDKQNFSNSINNEKNYYTSFYVFFIRTNVLRKISFVYTWRRV